MTNPNYINSEKIDSEPTDWENVAAIANSDTGFAKQLQNTSWENPGKFPEFIPKAEKSLDKVHDEDEDDWDSENWENDIDWDDSDEEEPAVEETPEQKAKAEAELAERKRQQRIQIELERWDEGNTLTDFKAENPTVFSSIRSYIGQGRLDSVNMSLLIEDKKDDVVKWFTDEQYSEALPKMIQEFGLNKTTLEKGLAKTPQEIINLAGELDKFNKIETANDDEKKVVKDLRSTFKAHYDEKLYTSEVTGSFLDLTTYMVNNPQGSLPITSIINGFMGMARSSEELTACLQGTKDLMESGDVDGIGIISDYCYAHDFDKSKLDAFKKNVIPMMRHNDPEVSILNRKDSTGGSAYACYYGQYGAADYTVSALTSKITPSNMNELLCAEREVPTSDTNKFERNRLDALELQGVLYRAREFIHDNMPGVHELLSSMLDYYDSKDDEQTHTEKTTELQRIVDDRMNGRYSAIYIDLDKYVFDLSNYEQKVEKRVSRIDSDKNNIEISSDVLRRLVKNTANSILEKPKTTDEELDKLLESLDIRADETTGEVHVDWKQTGELVKYINDYLIQHQGDTGIRPSMISAISYAEKMATHAMKDISRKDWHELPFDPEFKEFVRLQELIGSNDFYDERQFDSFYNGLVREMSKDFESDGVSRETYGKLQQHILQNLRGLAAKYNSNPNTSHRTGSLWSGNLAHELIGLAAK